MVRLHYSLIYVYFYNNDIPCLLTFATFKTTMLLYDITIVDASAVLLVEPYKISFQWKKKQRKSRTENFSNSLAAVT